MSRTAVIICTRNRRDEIDFTLDNVRALDPAVDQIIVYDDGSEDGTPAHVLERHPDVQLIASERSRGPCYGRNRALERLAAGVELVIFLDDDAHFVDLNAIDVATERFTKEPELAALSFRLLNNEGGPCAPWLDRPFYAATFLAGASVFRPGPIREAGGFREPFVIYAEEDDLAVRIIAKGHRLAYSPDVAVWHRGGHSGRARPAALLQQQFRNTLLCCWLNEPVGHALLHMAYILASRGAFMLRQGRYDVVLPVLLKLPLVLLQWASLRRPIAAGSLKRANQLRFQHVESWSELHCQFGGPTRQLYRLLRQKLRWSSHA